MSSYGFITTPLGLAVLAWYPSVLRSWVSSLALFIFLVMVIVEIFYYSWWRKELERERNKIAEDIRAEHQRNVGEVASHIVERLTLHLLTNAGLGDEKNRNSAYYRRVDELSQLLTKTYTHVKEKCRLAERRLGSNLDEFSLRIRQELLDVAALKRGYKRLGTSMAYKRNELRELTEILLRTMGRRDATPYRATIQRKGSLDVARSLLYAGFTGGIDGSSPALLYSDARI